MRDPTREMASSVSGVLEWRKKTFLSYQSMGETKSRKAEENLEKRVNNIAEILFSPETDEKIKTLIKYHIRYEDSHNFDLKVCEFLRKINQRNIRELGRGDLDNKYTKAFLAIKDDYNYIYKNDDDKAEDIAERIFVLYKKYRKFDKPNFYFRTIFELTPSIRRKITVQNIFEKIQTVDYYFAENDYYKERDKFFKNKSKLEITKAKYEIIRKKIMQEAEAVIPFALHCKNLDNEKYELLKLCFVVDDIKRELEVLEAVHSGYRVDHYLLEIGMEYVSAISLLKRLDQ